MIELTLELSSIISQRKDNYYIQLVKKLNDLQRNAKTYWSILKTFFNGRKIPIIPPWMERLCQILKKKPANSMNFPSPMYTS